MAPLLAPRQSLEKDKFSPYFKLLKAQTYSDTTTATRASGPHHIRSIAWNPQGTFVATGAADRVLRVWNPEKPNVRFSTELKGHNGAVVKVAFNPVKEAELCSVSDDGVMKIWDVRNKLCINEVKDLGAVNALAWEPDEGKSILVGNKTGKLFQLSPTATAPISSYQHPVRTTQMAFNWNGKMFYLPTVEGEIRMLNYPDFKPAAHYPYQFPNGQSNEFFLKGHTTSCLTAEMSPTGRFIATGGSDCAMAIFDTTDWICQRAIMRAESPIRNISFTFDGMYIANSSDEGSRLEVTHTTTGDLVHTFKTAGPPEVVAWAPLRYCLAYSDLGVLRIVGVSAAADTERR